MARKPTKKNTPIEDPIQEDVAEVLEASQQAVATLQAAHSDERDTVSRIIGHYEMARSIASFADVVSLSKLAHIKETRMYKALAGKKGVDKEGNEIADVGTWDGFCAALGLSRSKVDEDLTNLRAFGEEALQQLTSVGAGYRELRQFRRLPEDEKTALIEVAQSGDKDSFIDLAEGIIGKHIKEKAELNKKLEEAKAGLEAKDVVAEANAKRINQLQEKAALIKKLPPDERAQQARSEASKYADEAEALIRAQLRHAFQEVMQLGITYEDNHLLENEQGDWLAHRLDLLDDALLFLRNQLGIDRTRELTRGDNWADPDFDADEPPLEVPKGHTP